MIHIHRYKSVEAPLGSVLCFPRDGEPESDIDNYIPVARSLPLSPDDKPVRCSDCPEPSVIAECSWDEGIKGYCANCAYVHEDFEQKGCETDDQ